MIRALQKKLNLADASPFRESRFTLAGLCASNLACRADRAERRGTSRRSCHKVAPAAYITYPRGLGRRRT